MDPKLNTDSFAKFDRLREKVEMAEADALRELASDHGPAHEMEPEIIAADWELDSTSCWHFKEEDGEVTRWGGLVHVARPSETP